MKSQKFIIKKKLIHFINISLYSSLIFLLFLPSQTLKISTLKLDTSNQKRDDNIEQEIRIQIKIYKEDQT